jgi:2-polyprenyl-3-methyl-5-hydroxy-6-metoxy-1,4-benzoquinol methylase
VSRSDASVAGTASYCPLCAGPAYHAFCSTDRNRGIPAGRFDYQRCANCGSYFLRPVPGDLARHYPMDYHAHPDRVELDRYASAEEPKLDLLRRAVESGRLLEIGPGTGLFSRAAVLAGFEVTVIEMDKSCCEYIDTVVGARAIQSDRPELALSALGSFHAVAMWQVIEHLPDPWAVFEAAVAHLEPGGAIIVGTPNPDSMQFRLLGRYWAHLDAPRHLFLIPASALQSKATELGLRHVMTTTSDPAGRHWNRFGWEYALRRHPARNPSTSLTRALSLLLTTAVRPFETRGLAGATYTSVFLKR